MDPSPQTNSSQPNSTPLYKKWWFWLLIVLLFVGVIFTLVVLFAPGSSQSSSQSSNQSDKPDKPDKPDKQAPVSVKATEAPVVPTTTRKPNTTVGVGNPTPAPTTTAVNRPPTLPPTTLPPTTLPPTTLPPTTLPPTTLPPTTTPAPAPCLARGANIYVGCGFAYGSLDEAKKQCTPWPTTLRFIGDGIPNNNPCALARGTKMYQGCGYVYASKDQRNIQCGQTSDPDVSWIGDGLS
jgi:hypothetical protein